MFALPPTKATVHDSDGVQRPSLETSLKTVTRDRGGIKISARRNGKKAGLWRAGHAGQRTNFGAWHWPIGNTRRLSPRP